MIFLNINVKVIGSVYSFNDCRVGKSPTISQLNFAFSNKKQFSQLEFGQIPNNISKYSVLNINLSVGRNLYK